MKIAVTGATGQLGRITIEKLKAKLGTENIIGLARDPKKAEDLGVTVRQADYNDPQSFVSALAGVDKVFLISSNELGKRTAQHKNVIDAAKQAGVKQLVYTSLLRADSSPLSVAQEHKPTENDLKQSGLTYTILRNGWYTENYTNSIPAALANGAFYGSAGEGKIASASREDYADAAVAVLTGTGHENQTYELVGDNAYTLAEMAAEISKQTGKAIPYVDLAEADYATALEKAGLGDFAPIIARWDTDAKNGALYDEDKTLSRLINRPTTPMADTVKAQLQLLD